MTCTQCDTELICRLKDYGGNYPPSLQWQNYDGAAHYKTTDGKNFDCNVPDEDELEQTRIPSKTGDVTVTATVPTRKPKLLSNSNLDEKIESIDLKVEKIVEMVQAIFHYTVDEQLKKK